MAVCILVLYICPPTCQCGAKWNRCQYKEKCVFFPWKFMRTNHVARKKVKNNLGYVIHSMYPCLMVFSQKVRRPKWTNQELVATHWNTKSKNYLFMRRKDKNFSHTRAKSAHIPFPNRKMFKVTNEIMSFFSFYFVAKICWFYLNSDCSRYSRSLFSFLPRDKKHEKIK